MRSRTLTGRSILKQWAREKFGVKTRRTAARLARSLLCVSGLLLTLSQRVCDAFNLDVDDPAVYSGPSGSYFGYAVDFYLADSSSASVVIGAPKASTSQANITEGGSVFYCPWSLGQSDCHVIEFDTKGDRAAFLNETEQQVEFKSNQWFGATVRCHGDTILACAPLYSWRTEKDTPHSDPTGTCYLSAHNFTKFVEYAPCRTEISDAVGQGYCQGGFSADFTTDGKVVLGGPGSYFWQGQVISAAKEDIINAYYPGYFMQSVENEIQTKQEQAVAKHDNDYQGYSVAAGEFSGDQVEDFVAGVPKGPMLLGSVSVLNGTDLKTMITYTGEQIGSYFGYAVATTDINSDGMTDLLVGAPMFMIRSPDGRLEEMGRVYVYLQSDPLKLEPRLPHLTGTQVYGRFGSTIAPLGDLNQDGFNDVAISCPFGGQDQQGLVYIYNGHSLGLGELPSQVITGQWATGHFPASFGFALRGAKDLDMNGYPDLIVGAFGVDKAVLYRSRPIVNAGPSLTVHPTMINPEEKNCMISSGNMSVPVSCVSLNFCISADGKHLPAVLDFEVEVRLDSRKQKQKDAVKRALFLDSQQPSLKRSVRVHRGERVCNHTRIYLRDEKEFRDKLSSIYVALNFSLDPKAPADSHGLRPILNYRTTSFIEQKVLLLPLNPSSLQLWAGLRFTVPRLKDTHKTVQFELQIRSKNENNSHSEVAPYKLEVVVQAEVILQGVSRPDKVSFPPANWKATKRYDVEQDVGPPVEHIYELVNNGPSRISHTPLELHCPLSVQDHTLLYPLDFSTEGPINCTSDKNMNRLHLKLQHASTEPPILALKASEHLVDRRDVHKHQLAHLTNLSCSNSKCWVLHCNVGLLEKGTTAIVKVRSRVWAETFIERSYKPYVLECVASYNVKKMPYAIPPKLYPSGHKKVVTPVVWNKPDVDNSVPLWIIILAILVGLLLLALLIYILYKFGFFKRSLPYGTAMEKAQLKPQAASEA
ncbi:integrin alpha-5 [Brachionichthys hirsutus]|uniref:integrin alpha-5 n=1 Tax=Brachionichthys hirsutus TaxID=412623 RepID=UPI003604EE3A